MTTLNVPEGDYGYSLNFTVQDNSGSAYDLTGYTVTLKVWDKQAPGTAVLTATCSIVVAADGTCSYEVQEGDFATPGNYEAELELTKTGIVESTINFDLNVKRSR